MHILKHLLKHSASNFAFHSCRFSAIFAQMASVSLFSRWILSESYVK